MLSGLELLDDGRLVPRATSRTADECPSRADALRAKLTARRVHPDVLRYCRAELVQRNYFHAVLEAAKSVSAKIRDRTGLESDGSELIDEAFTLRDSMPPLAFNSLRTPSERSAHSGYAHFARGCRRAFATQRPMTPRWSSHSRRRTPSTCSPPSQWSIADSIRQRSRQPPRPTPLSARGMTSRRPSGKPASRRLSSKRRRASDSG